MRKTYIVAEIGCNHNGSKELAKKMVDAAKNCNVDAVKFQTFKADELISCIAPKADYQIVTTGSSDTQLEMTRKLELSQADCTELFEYAKAKGLDVFSTPFDLDSIAFLETMGQKVWKIPSGEITNLPYLERIRDIEITGKKIILSTGMSTIDEIRIAVDILKTNCDDIVLLHCNTEYPTPDKDVNISAIPILKEKFPECSIGYSDHSVGCVAAVMSVSYGVELIEKHFTLDKNFEGPDHKASATPEEMTALVDNVRRADVMYGCGQKIVTESEAKNSIVARKSIVARRTIHKGDVFTEENVTCKRPGNGISPMKWYEVLGRKAEKDFEYDELITITGINNQK